MLILFISIILLTYFSLSKTLSFGLTGDDWLALYRYILDFPDFAAHFKLSSYINDHSNYNFADLLIGIIYSQFAFNPFPYYLISIITRTFAAISFYYAVSIATKDKLTGYLSALLFSVMFTGIETTNWVFNMNTYISIILFNVFIYFYTRKANLNFYIYNLALGIILGLSFIITPNRMHGLLFVIPFIALLKLEKIDITNLKHLFIRALLFYSPIFGFRFLFRSANDISYTAVITESLTKTDFLYIILANLGNIMIPENMYKLMGISQGGKAFIALLIFLIIGIFFYRYLKSSADIAKFALLSLSLTVSFILMPLLVFGPVIMPTDHRYLIIPGVYMLVIYASFFSILWRSKKQLFIILALVFIGVIFFSNFLSLNNYFDNLSNKGRLAADSQRHFTYLISQINRPDNDAPLVLLFIPDDAQYLYNAITFGLPFHLMLLDKRMGLDMQKAPFAVDNFPSLINVLSSETSDELRRYGYKPVKIPITNVYAFKLEHKQLQNITLQVRQLLQNRLPNLN